MNAWGWVVAALAVAWALVERGGRVREKERKDALEEDLELQTKKTDAQWAGRTDEVRRLEELVAFLKKELSDSDDQLRALSKSILPASSIGSTPGGGLVGMPRADGAASPGEPPDGK